MPTRRKAARKVNDMAEQSASGSAQDLQNTQTGQISTLATASVELTRQWRPNAYAQTFQSLSYESPAAPIDNRAIPNPANGMQPVWIATVCVWLNNRHALLV